MNPNTPKKLTDPPIRSTQTNFSICNRLAIFSIQKKTHEQRKKKEKEHVKCDGGGCLSSQQSLVALFLATVIVHKLKRSAQTGLQFTTWK